MKAWIKRAQKPTGKPMRKAPENLDTKLVEKTREQIENGEQKTL